MRIFTFDTTLRDGTQGKGISFSVEDKLAIARKLDEFGIDYIEGGWPGSNPKDEEFFRRARELKFAHSRLTAFGSTRFVKNPAHEDRNLHSATTTGRGPLDALHRAVRACRDRVCPDLREPRLLDYKVRLLDAADGVGGKVRVLVGWTGGRSSWSTAGVSENAVEASWSALLDAVRLELVRMRSEIGELAHEQG